ncbi:MAG: hypothetical protein GX803_00525 [Lentisphaerae bacterium]|jgi:hypothetical protein|nr:hypothetical protein [Lentisphaerota bacterium]
MKTLLFVAEQHGAELNIKNSFSSMLTKGATIPVHLLCSAGFAVCQYSFTPHASHLNWTCRVHNTG